MLLLKQYLMIASHTSTYSVQGPIKKCNGDNDTQIIITGVLASSVLVELKSQQVRPELHDYLNTAFFWNNITQHSLDH